MLAREVQLQLFQALNKESSDSVLDVTELEAAVRHPAFGSMYRAFDPPICPKAVTYHGPTVMWLFMIGHTLGRIDIPYLLPTFQII